MKSYLSLNIPCAHINNILMIKLLWGIENADLKMKHTTEL